MGKQGKRSVWISATDFGVTIRACRDEGGKRRLVGFDGLLEALGSGLVLDHIAALAGVGRSTVNRTLGAAQGLGLMRIEERRLSAWRNAPNVITITSAEWSTYLRMRREEPLTKS